MGCQGEAGFRKEWSTWRDVKEYRVTENIFESEHKNIGQLRGDCLKIKS